MSLKGTETEKNLLKAFAGESQARNRYTMFSKIAQKEGYDGALTGLLNNPNQYIQTAQVN